MKPCFGRLALSLAAGLLWFCGLMVSNDSRATGITIITHGYDSDVNDWVTAMADRISNYPRFPGTNFTTYKVTLTTDGASYFYTVQLTNGVAPAASDSGEIIVKLDWSQMAGDPDDSSIYDISTYNVASVASLVLLQTNSIVELGGHALAEFPIHLIGHSRGGSLMSELSRQLGTNGVWVDHLTTLDPHPLNNDGFFDPPQVVDAPVHTYASVLFHDNYWENSDFYPYGESVAGAYVRYLPNLSGGYPTAHSNVHLWYHGTIDWRTPLSDTAASIGSSERLSWWASYEQAGTNAGFEYSLIGGTDRLSADRPLGAGNPAIRDGYNQLWDLGAGTSNNRTLLTTNNGGWPNLIKINRTDTNRVVQGQSASVKFFYQWARPGTSNAIVSVYLDDDLNALNNNQKLLAQVSVPGTGPGSINSVTVSVPFFATNASPGWHSLLAEISGGGRTRYLYAPERVQVTPNQPPTMDIARINSSQVRVGVDGLPTQTIILQSSTDLFVWQSLATNIFSSTRWVYTNNVPGGSSGQFYRAMLGS